jgi:hypothetical protein
MSADLLRAVATHIPTQPKDGVINEFGVRKILSGTTSVATLLPEEWCNGQLVGIQCVTNNVTMACSRNSSAQVDKDLTATTAGATTKAGLTIKAGVMYPLILPKWTKGEKMYLIHQAAADNTVLEVAPF